jgi:hypothetical protein
VNFFCPGYPGTIILFSYMIEKRKSCVQKRVRLGFLAMRKRIAKKDDLQS